MPSDINIDTVIDMYLKEHGERAQARYEELFGPLQEEEYEGNDSEAEEDVDDADIGHEDRRSRGRRRRDEPTDVREFLEAPAPEPIVAMLQEEYDRTHEDNRPDARTALWMMGSEDWTWETARECVVYWFEVRAGTHAVHYYEPEKAFPIDTTMLYQELKARLSALGIAYRDHTDDPDLLPIQIIGNITLGVEAFRSRRKLEHWQVWSLVYDLAPRLLPSPPPYAAGPHQVWMIAASRDSFQEADDMEPSKAAMWTINLNANRGDLALMYCMTPRSAFTHLFRVDQDAGDDPFGGYSLAWTRITDKVTLPPITLQEMRTDPVLRRWHQVKADFRGLNRSPIPEDVWVRIKQLVAEKDPETAELLERYEVRGPRKRNGSLTETEFEDKVVIPILERLGWHPEKTLKRQHDFWIKVGSGRPTNVRADIVGYRGALSSEVILVIESKRKITSEAELKSAREQCESYCGKLRCSRFAVAAPEGIWVYDLRFPSQSELLAHVRSPSPTAAAVEKDLEMLAFDKLST